MFTTRILLSVLFLSGILTHPRSATALTGQFGLEFAIDAPWRIEPVPKPGGGISYGPIPITVVFTDANFEKDRGAPQQVAGVVGGNTGGKVGKVINWASGGIISAATGVSLQFTKWERVSVGNLKGIWVWEPTQPSNPEWIPIPLHLLREIERKGPKSVKGKSEPVHQICRPHLGEKCEALYNIGNAHEWHAMFWYTLKRPIKPGENIHLAVQVQTKKDRDCFPNPLECDTNIIKWQNFLVVHAGEEPLPRFSKDWLYGDLHYHSQMTDNEGESGYAYRNVVRALGAMGMDFVFATDHASDSVQVDGGGEARDLNPSRYLMAKQILYASGGANEEVARDTLSGGIANFHTRGYLPQVFMGEEVDTKAEMVQTEFLAQKISFGDGLLYPWSNVSGCLNLSPETYCQINPTGCKKIPLEQFCSARFSENSSSPTGTRYFTQDNQGIPYIDIQPEPSRRHGVYFPFSGSPDATGFVPSSTRKYGGASRSLDTMLPEIEAKGVIFLAHPLSSSNPGGAIGPDIVPYSALSLDQAWSSKAVLGLQFWNENDRYASPFLNDSVDDWMTVIKSGDTHFFNYELPWLTKKHRPFPWEWKRPSVTKVSSELYQGAYTWDAYLRKGLNLEQTRRLPWLPAGEPRKWYMAGGSDAHGDWNFRRYGEPCLDRWCAAPVGDTAIGNPRNLVMVGQPVGQPAPGLPSVRRHTNQQVIAALQTGQFTVTDGPAIRIAIDRNRNGQLDDTDFTMGSTFNLFPGEQVPLLIEWVSTPEFGRIKKIDVYLGTKDRTYAPEGHGPPHTVCSGQRRIESTEYLKLGGEIVNIKSGKTREITCEESAGAYFRQGMGMLRIDLANPGLDSSVGYRGMARVYLHPNEPLYLSEQNGKLFYLRAYAQTYGRTEAASGCTVGPLVPGKCGDRHAYTNPIWGRYNQTCSPNSQSLDTNNNGMPDTCEHSGGWPDLCAAYGRGTRSCQVVEAMPPLGASAGYGITESAGHLLLLN